MATTQEENGTVIRIKRKRTADPLNALIVHCGAKKSKVEEISTRDDGNSFFQFAGTLAVDEVKSTTRLLKALQHTKPTDQKNIDKLKEKNRKTQKETQNVARYKIISKLREEDDTASHEVNKNITTENDDPKNNVPLEKISFEVIDIVATEETLKENNPTTEPDTLMCNSVKMTIEKLTLDDSGKEPDYVYDVYYAPGSILNADDEILRIEEFYDEIIIQDDVDLENEEYYDDDDDSNAEDNWRNDYPDEDGCFSSDEEQYVFGDPNNDSDSSGDEFSSGYNRYRRGLGRRKFDPYAEDDPDEQYFHTVVSDNDDDT